MRAPSPRTRREASRPPGSRPLPTLTIVAGRQDYDAIARRLKEARAEAVLFAGYPTEARVILDGLRREGSDTRVSWLGFDWRRPDFADTAGADPERLRVLYGAQS